MAAAHGGCMARIRVAWVLTFLALRPALSATPRKLQSSSLRLRSSTVDGQADVPSTATIGLFFDAPLQLGSKATSESISFVSTGANADIRAVKASDVDQVFIQGGNIFLTPVPPLQQGRSYTLTVPALFFAGLTAAASVTFTVRAEDVRRPVPLFTSPSGDMQSKLSLDQVAPFVQFSEMVMGTAGRNITFNSARGQPLYTIDAADTNCGTGGTVADACVEIDPLGSKVSFLPRGRLPGGGSARPAPWAVAGASYSVKMEAGTFTDAARPGAVARPSNALEFTIAVSSDTDGPQIKSASPSSTEALDPMKSSIFLAFNDRVQAGDGSLSIMAWNHVGNRPPSLLSAGPAKLLGDSLRSARWRQTIVLVFDGAVQSGSGNHTLEVYNAATDAKAFEVPMHEAIFAGNKVLFSPSASLLSNLGDMTASDMAIFVRTSSADAILSADFEVPTLQRVDTKGANSISLGSSSAPSLLWSTADEYVCLPGDNPLPDITLYMSKALSSIDSTKVVQLFECDSSGCGLPLWSLRPRMGEISISIDGAVPFKITLATASLPKNVTGGKRKPLGAFRRYHLVLETGLLRGAGSGQSLSARLTLELATCQVEYDTPSSSLVRLYSPEPFAPSSVSGARRFKALVPETSIRDAWGNMPASLQTYFFAHEAQPPQIDPQNSNPANAGQAGVFENVVLTFTEVVQCGSGKIEFWEVGGGAPSFNVDTAVIAAASVNAHNAISGKHVVITPKTLCDGSPACGDLVAGKKYFVKTSQPGVFKDVIGNPLAKLSTDGSWTWEVVAQDPSAPEIAFFAGYEVLPPRGVYPYQIKGYVYFTKKIAARTGAPAVYLQDCGAAFDCSNVADNVLAHLPAEMSFGVGSSRSGADGYGLLKFSRYVTKVPRRYKLVISPNSVQSVVTDGDPQTGPSSVFVVEIDAGQLPPRSVTDSSPPRLAWKTPVNTETGVAPDTSIVINFNEDIQRGSGLLRLCLNRDAEVDGEPACDPARFADGSPAQTDVADAIMGRRRATFIWPQPLASRQLVYVMLPSGIVKDVGGGNPNYKVEETIYSFTVADVDAARPTLDYYAPPVGTNGALRLYFDEAMQQGSDAILMETVSGSDLNTVSDLVTTIDGRVATVRSAWKLGVQYRLNLSSSVFSDLMGNSMVDTVDTQTFQVLSSADYFLPSGFSSSAPFRVIKSDPEDGAVEVVPSTSFKVVFSSAVQAGTGDVTFGTSKMPIGDCIFAGNTMVCNPSSHLAPDSLYKVTVPAVVVKDIAGNILANSTTFEFRTINSDLIPPALVAVSNGPPPSRFTQSTAEFAPGSVLSLSFSEKVQAGVGAILLQDCSPGDPTKCHDGVGEGVQDSLLVAINVAGATPNVHLLFNGSIVYIAQDLLKEGRKYSVKTSALGTLVDVAGRPLPHITSGFEFNVFPVDTTPPTVVAYTPEMYSIGVAPPSSDMRLYFSEAVQAVHGDDKTITISHGARTEYTFNAGSREVEVFGSMVVINPHFDAFYGELVKVSISSGSFADLAGNAFTGLTNTTPYQWQAALNTFEKVGPMSPSGALPQRHGMVLQYLKSGLFAVGGRSGAACYNETYRSTDDGKTWNLQSSASSNASMPLPAVAHSAATSDAKDCIWLLGGQCSGAGTTVLWKTCSSGAIWQPLPMPVSEVTGVVWPASFSSVAITILGGWQLVVVDLQRGDCWLFLNRQASKVVRTAERLPFAPRVNATLLASSSSDLFLVAGDTCNNAVCSDPSVHTDVWKSAASVFVGRSWVRLTAQFGASLPVVEAAMLGKRHLGVAMTRDDTIYLLGGQRGDGSAVATVLTSTRSAGDTAFDSLPRLTIPSSNSEVLPRTSVILYFAEAVKLLDASSVRLTDLGADKNLGGSGANADTEVALEVVAERQVLKMSVMGGRKLQGGRRYQVAISDGAIADAAGNIVASFTPYYFSIAFDATAPSTQLLSPAGGSVPPWTTFVLKANEELIIGSGSLQLACAVGSAFKLSVSEAQVVGPRAFFKLPGARTLTQGQEYTLRIPAGAFLDKFGNALVATTFQFTVLSGVSLTRANGYSGEDLLEVIPGPGDGSDVVKPVLESLSPAAGATDVPTKGTSVVVRYSEQVTLGEGSIVLTDSLGVVKAFNESVTIISNGLRIALPELKNGLTYTLSLLDGAVTDTAGNAAAAASTTFTCLAGVRDRTPPSIVMTEPAEGAQDVRMGTGAKIQIWLSEAAVAGNGNITIKGPSGKSSHVLINSTDVIVDGPRVQINVNASDFTVAGSYTVTLPQGGLRDVLRTSALGVVEGGGNAIVESSFTFVAAAADFTRPSLVSVAPPAEAHQHTFALPPSVSMVLAFSETVQAGSGRFKIVGQSSSQVVSMSAASDEVRFAGSQVVITPEQDLASGDVYSVIIDSSAVADVVGNNFAGVTYNISTAPLISFVQVGEKHFDKERYLISAVVDSSNNLYAVGGVDGTSGAPLNDVWRLSTGRASHCAAYANTSITCSRSSCTGTPPHLGSWSYDKVVWRSPSVGGHRCKVDGAVRSQMGDVIESSSFVCPCPHCPKLSSPLPANMVNKTYTLAYSQVPATGEVRPILCQTGYTASANFRCQPDGVFAAVWRKPYPACKADPCVAPPLPVPFQDAADALRVTPCSLASPSRPVAHNTSCPIKCKPGYALSGRIAAIRCVLGEYETPVCAPRKCASLPKITKGRLSCPGAFVEVGSSCQIICNAGYKIIGNQSIHCLANSSKAESAVEFTLPGRCVPHSCGVLRLQDPRGIVTNYSEIKVDTGGVVTYPTRSVAHVGCGEGYTLTEGSFDSFECLPVSDAPEVASVWVGALACKRRSCAKKSPSERGWFTCEEALYGDICKLECPVGYALQGGDGKYECNSNGTLVGSGACEEVDCPAVSIDNVAHATESNCPETMTHGARCTVKCEKGYNPGGYFSCFYGGYNQVPACIEKGSRAIVKRFTLSALTLSAQLPSKRTASELAADKDFWKACEGAIADSLNEVQISAVVVQNVIVLDLLERRRLQSAAQDTRLWITFKVRAANQSAVVYWLSAQQALTKARLAASLQTRMKGMLVSQMVLAPPRLAIEYAMQVTTVQNTEEPGFWDRLFSAEDQDAVTVLLGCLVGIFLGLGALAFCCRKGGGCKDKMKGAVLHVFDENGPLAGRLPPMLSRSSRSKDADHEDEHEHEHQHQEPDMSPVEPQSPSGRFWHTPAPL